MSRSIATARPAALSYFERGKVSAAALDKFFAAAAKLHGAEPWLLLDDDEALAIDIPSLGVKGACVSIIGGQSAAFGFALFESFAAFQSFAAQGEAVPGRLGATVLSVTFEASSTLPKPMRKEVKQHGWPVAGPHAYPIALWTDANLRPLQLTDRDYLRVTAITAALAEFFAAYAGPIEDGELPLVATNTIETLPDKPAVTVTFPHPDDDRPEPDEDWDDEDGDEPEAEAREVAEEEMEELAEEFLGAQEQAGRGGDWLDNASFLLQCLAMFKLDYADGTSDRWTQAFLREFLFDYFPRKVTADDRLIALTPEIVQLYFGHLASKGTIAARLGADLVKYVVENSAAFMGAAKDPRNFGVAKSAFASMQSVGVDITNEEEIHRFLARQNAQRIRVPSIPAPVAVVSAPQAPHQQHKAWVWSGEGTPPDPKALCPCGSGKRYKKCCLPR